MANSNQPQAVYGDTSISSFSLKKPSAVDPHAHSTMFSHREDTFEDHDQSSEEENYAA